MLIMCPECNKMISDRSKVCVKCGFPLDEYFRGRVEHPVQRSTAKEEFNGIYRYTLFGKKVEVRCPRCGSEDCSHYHEQKSIPGKTKTRYTVNLNPLKPFTLINKKEKVIREESTYIEKKIICNSCGTIF